jgi:non-ribosomal peptide synthetase component F
MGNTGMAAAPQHLQALKRANRVRLARAGLKRKVGAGDLTAAQVVLTCPWEAESMPVSELLMSQRRWGRTRTRRLLMSLGVPENKRVGTLTQRQRFVLAGLLSAKAGVPLPAEAPASLLQPAGSAA